MSDYLNFYSSCEGHTKYKKRARKDFVQNSAEIIMPISASLAEKKKIEYIRYAVYPLLKAMI